MYLPTINFDNNNTPNNEKKIENRNIKSHSSHSDTESNM